MPGIEDYLSGLWQAITGNSQQASNAPAGVYSANAYMNQQPAGSASPSFPALLPNPNALAQGAASSSPTTAPQGGGFMQGAANFLGNPLTQAALSGYFNAIGTPRLQGRGGMIANAGLGALQGFNTAETGQTKQQEEQIAMQKAQADLAAAQQQSKVFGELNPQQQQVAAYPSLATFQEKAGIEQNNKNSVAAFLAGHPKDQAAAAFAQPYGGMQTAVTPGDIEKDYQEKLAAPAKAEETQASIAEKKAQTQRLKNQPAAGTEANWYNPVTKQYYRGAQKSPNDVPASVAQQESALKLRGAWQKEYDNAKTKYITEHTTTGFTGNKYPPNEADVDAYARSQADAIYGPLSSIGASSGASADESASTADPLSLIPEGATPGMEGGVHGYRTSDGVFHSVE